MLVQALMTALVAQENYHCTRSLQSIGHLIWCDQIAMQCDLVTVYQKNMDAILDAVRDGLP